MTEGNTNFSDFSMYTLFCSELKNYISILKEILTSFKGKGFTDAEMEALIRAAHSIKSAAKIMQYDLLNQMAASIEEFLLSIREIKKSVSDIDIVLLIEAIDLIAKIPCVTELELKVWFTKHQDEFILKTKKLKQLNQGFSRKEHESTSGVTKKAPSFLIDKSMLDLFRIEVETHVQTLNEGLLSIEQGTTNEDVLASLMRAAHSIKGAARVVGLDVIVKLSHCLEDCFVAAQKMNFQFNSDKVDVLLRGVDILAQMALVKETLIPQWLESHKDSIDELEKIIADLIKDKNGTIKSKKTIVQSKIDFKPAIQAKQVTDDRILRVTAQNLSRLMGLAGESLVESRWLQPFADSLQNLKGNQNELASIVDGLRNTLPEPHLSERSKLYLSELQHKTNDCRQKLSDRLTELEMFIGRHASLSDRLYHEVIQSRMRPFSDGVEGFPRFVRDLARSLGKNVHFELLGKTTLVDRDILEKLEAPLNHLLRNAVDHGIETPEIREAKGKNCEGKVTLEARHRGGMLAISVKDDGAGINFDHLRQKIIQMGLVPKEMASNLTQDELVEFLFLPGFTTSSKVSEVSGRGVGLDVVQRMVQEVGGIIRTNTVKDKGTTFYLQLPLTLSVIRALIVEVSLEPYAIPLSKIDRILIVKLKDIEFIENRQFFRFEGQNIGLVPCSQILELEEQPRSDLIHVIVISDRQNFYGIAVDKIVGERELVLQELDPALGKVQDISSGAFMENGDPVLVIDIEDLLRSINILLYGDRLHPIGCTTLKETMRTKRILVVDDSATVREVECKLLRNNGYVVDTAVDGMDAWHAARHGNYDLILTDVDMPRMNGLELAKKLKSDEKLKNIKVMIISYKDRNEDRVKGREAGSDYYLSKSSFQDETFLNAVHELIGKPVVMTNDE